MSSLNPSQIISQINRLIEADKYSEIRLNANGGNSILIVCNPLDEINFTNLIKNDLDKDKFEIIDLNNLFLNFVKENEKLVVNLFDLLQGSVNQIFKAPSGEESNDFFKIIIQAISKSFLNSKIPVLVNTGVLYGAEIDNIQIMEHEAVMNACQPMVLLYPATHDGDTLNFLGKRSASKYRCMIIS